MPELRWNLLPEPDSEIIKILQKELGISESLCRLLAQRGVSDFDSAKDFFRPSLEHLHDPYLMKDMKKAVKRINRAVNANERILIYGDYDVDGTTAVSLVFSFLKNQYENIDTYIPDRYKEGYGVSLAGIDYAEDNGISLIIALDCGIKAVKQVDYAKEKGIDFIICDHHRPAEKLPDAVAILDPKQEDCEYPYDELSGCGVGFKLVQALCQKWDLPDETWHPLLDLLAVSIGADIVPITGENRVLAHFGLQKINENPRRGFALLKELSGRKTKEMSITDVVFMIGPRINAAGRVAHGRLAVELLTSEDEKTIAELSKTINQHNTDRKVLDSSITVSALQMIEDQAETERFTTVLAHEDWHKGVIGIVASRLIETHYRPTVVFTESKGVLAGSARSVRGFDVYNALEKCDDILEQFGGHKYAAGMTLQKDRFEDFKNRFEEVVAESILPEQRVPELDIDAKLSFAEITPKFYRILKQFAPFGPQNLQPVFQTDGLEDFGFSRAVGGDKTHLRICLREPSTQIVFNGIGFGMADKLELIRSGQPISIAYHIDENEFNGEVHLQLRLKDLKVSDS